MLLHFLILYRQLSEKITKKIKIVINMGEEYKINSYRVRWAVGLLLKEHSTATKQSLTTELYLLYLAAIVMIYLNLGIL